VIEFLLMLVTGTATWLADSVVTPVMDMLLDQPWLSGVVLVAVLAVIVGDTMRTEHAEARREEVSQR
jgi:hypothetical protein